MPACSKCGKDKDQSEFRFDSRRGTHRKDCKDCERSARVRRYHNDKEPEKVQHKSYMAKYLQQPGPAWKQKVRNDTRQMILQGLLLHPGCCEECGVTADTEKIQVHHMTYMVPNEVLFLCTTCHNEWHKNNPSPPEPEPEWLQDWYERYKSYPEEECSADVD